MENAKMKPTKLYLRDTKQKELSPEERENYIVMDVVPFEAVNSEIILNSAELGGQITHFFKSISQDVEGCFIGPDPKTFQPECCIYLKNKDYQSSEGSLKGIERIVNENTKGMSYLESSRRIQNRQRNKIYQLTNEFKKVMINVLPTNNKGQVEWDRFVTELAEPTMGYGFSGISQVSVVKVSGINVNKLMQYIYGFRDEEGTEYEYIVSCIRPGVGIQSGNFIWGIRRLNIGELEKKFKELQGVSLQGSIPMFR